MKKLITPIILSLILFISCEKDEDPLGSETILNINFSHTVDNENFTLCCGINTDSLPFTNAVGQAYNIQRLSYLISDIFLHDEV